MASARFEADLPITIGQRLTILDTQAVKWLAILCNALSLASDEFPSIDVPWERDDELRVGVCMRRWDGYS